MLGKLIKHEFKSSAQLFGFMYLILIVVTVINKIFWVIDLDNPVINVLRTLFTVIDVLIFIAAFIVTIVYIIYRFYRTMISDEAYLSFTLPVTPSQLILSKTIVAFIWLIVTTFVVFIAGVILVLNTDMYADVVGFYNTVKEIMDKVDGSYTMLILLIIATLSGFIYSILMLYSSMGIGQLFNKHKVWGSVLGYVIFYIIMQVISSVVLLVGSISNKFTDAVMENIDAEINNISDGIYWAQTYIDIYNTYLSVMVIITIVYIFIYFLISRFLFTKKLNLQ